MDNVQAMKEGLEALARMALRLEKAMAKITYAEKVDLFNTETSTELGIKPACILTEDIVTIVSEIWEVTTMDELDRIMIKFDEATRLCIAKRKSGELSNDTEFLDVLKGLKWALDSVHEKKFALAENFIDNVNARMAQ